MDPLRLAAQIVSGVGFLGAGVILRRGNDSITGLTTAAIIWGAAGIGVAVGAGFYWESAFGVALLIVSVELIPFLINFFGPKQLREKEVMLQITVDEAKNITKVIDHLKQQRINIKTIRIKDVEEHEHLLKLRAVIDQKRSTAELYYIIRSIDAVVHVDIESG
ncbi:Mg(2+) transport ATPase protein C [Geobacillus stearothermophilus]|nr:Mg(2+) transport ATPase protein C [Geobacillus stearothermophilus]